jgi:hypothetical protein
VWQRTDTLIRPAPTREADQFGIAVGLDGDVAVISSNAPNINFRAHIFRRSNGVWAQTQILDAGEGVCFQPVFAIENGVIAITAISAEGQGQIFVLREDASGEFRLSATIIPSGPRLALSDAADWLLVGFPLDNEGRGAVQVYRAVESNWIPHQTLIAIDGEPQDGFGNALAIDDRAIVVGAPFADPEEGSGAAYVFRREGDLWQETRKLQPAIDEQFPFRSVLGAQVALNDRFVMVRMLGPAAAVFLYDRSNNFDAPDFAFVPRPEDISFGHALDVSGPTVFVGYPSPSTGLPSSVHVYTADGLTANVVPSGEARAADSGGGASNLLQILLLAMLAAHGIFRSRVLRCPHS